MKFSLLINMKMPTYLLAEKFSCLAMFSKKELGIISNLRFISMKNFMLSCIGYEKSFITSGPGTGLCNLNNVLQYRMILSAESCSLIWAFAICICHGMVGML